MSFFADISEIVIIITVTGLSVRPTKRKRIKMLEILREHAQTILFEFMAEPHGSLLAGILLGIRVELPKEFYNDLIKTGTIHIVAASGFNISLVSKITIDTTSKFLKKKPALFISYLTIWFYVAIAGFSASVTRAALMASFAYTCQLIGRKYLGFWSLFLTCLIMILLNPEVITDVGFWLSVSSTCGILFLSGEGKDLGILSIEETLLKKGFKENTETIGIKNESFIEVVAVKIARSLYADFKTTFAAQIATLPILFVMFKHIPILSVLINLMVLWTIPIIMFLGCFKLFMGAWSGFVNKILGILLFLPLEFVVRVIKLSAESNFVGLDVTTWLEKVGFFGSILIVFVYYLILIVIVLKTKKNSSDL